MKRVTQIVVVCLALCLWGWDAKATIIDHEYVENMKYQFDDDCSDAYLVWNVFFGDVYQYKYENYEEYFRVVDLSNGKTKLHESPGYIIDRDINEYSGVLFAEETIDRVSITHLKMDGTDETVYQSEALDPVNIFGMQTVRAYINECLYYIKETNKRQYCLCRRDSVGEEFFYDLSAILADDSCENEGCMVNGYAIRSDGATAWITKQWSDLEDRYIENAIYMQKVNEDKEIILSLASIEELGYKEICSEGICWYSDWELLCFARGEHRDSKQFYDLLKIDIRNGSVENVVTVDGDKIRIADRLPAIGSNMVLSPNKKCIAYLCWANPVFAEIDLREYSGNRDVPTVLNLDTGELSYVYAYGSDSLNRHEQEWCVPQCWRVAWHE